MTSLTDSSSEQGMSIPDSALDTALTVVALLLPNHTHVGAIDADAQGVTADRRRGEWNWMRYDGPSRPPASRAECVGWRQWGSEQIESDALVLPLMMITFSCAYVLIYKVPRES